MANAMATMGLRYALIAPTVPAFSWGRSFPSVMENSFPRAIRHSHSERTISGPSREVYRNFTAKNVRGALMHSSLHEHAIAVGKEPVFFRDRMLIRSQHILSSGKG